MDPKLKHLEFIQAVVTRMAGNSFLLKGWSVTLVAALFALAAKESNPIFLPVAYYPVLVFWILDGYFLSQERMFRDLYDKVRTTPGSDTDFSMDASGFDKGRNTWSNSTLSTTLLLFYGTMFAAMIIVTIFVHQQILAGAQH
jgi:hypothetical protein